jgi:branched-chain amino acid transport system substrate-binding protein
MIDDGESRGARLRRLARRSAIPAVLSAAIAVGLLGMLGTSQAMADVTGVSSPACGAVEYGGAGAADVLMSVSDLPMQGASAGRSEQMVAAMRLALADAGWRAGLHGVAFQPCDDTLAATGLWDAERCRDNAWHYAADPTVFAVVGTYNSGCAGAMLPILNGAPGGPWRWSHPATRWSA